MPLLSLIYSFSWMSGAYGLIGPNKKIRRPHLFLTVKKGVKKSDVRCELKDTFQHDPKKYFELLREPKKKPKIKYLVNGVNDGSHSPRSVSSDQPAPGGGVLACNAKSNQSNPLRAPELPEVHETERDLLEVQGIGTLTMFCSPGGQHYALTCFHVGCANDQNRLNAAIHKVEDIQQIRNSLKSYADYAKRQQYYFIKGRGDSGSENNSRHEYNNNESISFGDDGCNHICLGDFKDYHFDCECDILSLKIPNNIKIDCKLADVIYLNGKEMWTQLNNVLKSRTPVQVEKIGYFTALTCGHIATSNFTYSLDNYLLFQDAIVVEGNGDSASFLEGGDSGSLVFIRDEKNRKMAFAYGVCKVDALFLPVQSDSTSSTDIDDDDSSEEDTQESSSDKETDSEDEFQDKDDNDDDDDDQSSEEIAFEDEPTHGPYFICLRLDTALKKLNLQNKGCFSDCGSKRK